MYKVVCLLLVALFGVVLCVPSQYDTEQVWVPGNLSYPLPKNALVGGLDSKGFKLYVGRFNYSGTIVPASVVAETGIAKGNTYNFQSKATDYQLLTTQDNMDYEWIRSYDGHLEDNAISVGTSSENERMFICRAMPKEGIFIGTLFLTRGRCVLTEVGNNYFYSFAKYEVLVAVPKANGTHF